MEKKILLVLLIFLSACVASPPASKKTPQKTCFDCHHEMKVKFAKGVIHRPVADQDCGACHLPHGLIGGIQLRQPAPGLCRRCHRSLFKEVNVAYVITSIMARMHFCSRKLALNFVLPATTTASLNEKIFMLRSVMVVLFAIRPMPLRQGICLKRMKQAFAPAVMT